jgi:hypothetical protein
MSHFVGFEKSTAHGRIFVCILIESKLTNHHAAFHSGVLVVEVGTVTILFHTHLIEAHSDFSMSDVEHRLHCFVAYLLLEVLLRAIAVSAMDLYGTECLPIVVRL